MLKGRDFAFAKRSFAIAASFGMAAILSVIVLGDESGYEKGLSLIHISVVRDEVLVEIETDKVVLEVPASADGILDAVLEDEGATCLLYTSRCV